MKLLIQQKYPNEEKKFSLLKKPVKTVLINKCLADKNIKSEYDEYLENYEKQHNEIETLVTSCN